MKQVILNICMGLFCFGLMGQEDGFLGRDITGEIPVINNFVAQRYEKIPNVAQYKNADWSHVVGIAYGIPLEQAYAIAGNDGDIDFFFYTKGGQMVLEGADGTYRVFHQGDAVFFSGTPWWGSAPGLADGYMKTYE